MSASSNALQSASLMPRFVFLDAAQEVTEINHPVHPRVETATLVRLKKDGREVQHTAASDDGVVDALVTTFSSIFRDTFPHNRFPKIECTEEAEKDGAKMLCLRVRSPKDAPAHMKHGTIVLKSCFNSTDFVRAASVLMLDGIQKSYAFQLQGTALKF